MKATAAVADTDSLDHGLMAHMEAEEHYVRFDHQLQSSARRHAMAH